MWPAAGRRTGCLGRRAPSFWGCARPFVPAGGLRGPAPGSRRGGPLCASGPCAGAETGLPSCNGSGGACRDRVGVPRGGHAAGPPSRQQPGRRPAPVGASGPWGASPGGLIGLRCPDLRGLKRVLHIRAANAGAWMRRDAGCARRSACKASDRTAGLLPLPVPSRPRALACIRPPRAWRAITAASARARRRDRSSAFRPSRGLARQGEPSGLDAALP